MNHIYYELETIKYFIEIDQIFIHYIKLSFKHHSFLIEVWLGLNLIED